MLNELAFDPSGISTHGLVYTTISRVSMVESLYLLQRMTHENFCVNKKVLEETKHLRTEASWKSWYIEKTIASVNALTISSLDTWSLCAHMNDIVHDEHLMKAMIICI